MLDSGIEQVDNNTNHSSYNYISSKSEYETELIKLKPQMGCSVYVPMGVDFCLGKKREFFKRLHLFGETKPCLNYTRISELKRNSITAGIKGGIGLRVSF